jgi:hypothetical protein
MFEEIKEEIQGIVKIAESCPEKFQISCFELLLQHALRQRQVSEEDIGKLTGPPQFELFCKQYDVTRDQLAQVYHFEDDECGIIVKSLGVTPKAKKQGRLGLLIGVQSLYSTGKPLVLKDNLIEACKSYDGYDASNFAANMKSHKNLFVAHDQDWKLTQPGLGEAAKLIRELGTTA